MSARRASHVALLACATTALWLGRAAQGQPLLDLVAAPGPLAAGQGEAATSESARLIHHADALLRTDDPRAAIKSGLRRLAARLIAAGESAGEAGSARVIAGYTLARRLPELDAAADAISGHTAAVDGALIDADLRAAIVALERADTPPHLALRAALAGLAPASPAPASVEPLAIEAVEPGAVAATQRLLALCDAARNTAVFAPGAAALELGLRDAIGVLRELPSGTPAARRERLVGGFERAVMALDASPSDPVALALLQDVAFLHRVSQTASRQQSSVLRRALESAADRSWAGGAIRVPGSLRRVLEAIDRGEGPRDEDLIRPLRPAARLLRQSLRDTDAGLAAALAEPEATSPALATAIAARAGARGDLRDLEVPSRIMAGAGESPADPWKGAAEAMLAAARDAAKPGSTRQPLRDLLRDIARFGRLAGEDSLRAEVARGSQRGPWETVTGLAPSTVVRAIDEARVRWLSGLDPRGRAAPEKAAAERLAALAEVMDTSAELVVLFGPGGSFGTSDTMALLIATPEWELRAASLESLSRPALIEFADAATEAVKGEPGAARATLGKAATGVSLARLAGRLAARAPKPSTAWSEAVQSVGIAEHDSSAARLAAICRYAEEAARARADGNANAALESWLAARAREALDSLQGP